MNEKFLGQGKRDSGVCINVNRILDSCRDKDCFEDVKVFLTSYGQEVIERAGSVRVKSAKIAGSKILVEPIQFNRGFYQITVRMFTRLCIECCVQVGKSHEIEGIAITEKKVVLYGSEGSVRVFKSDTTSDFCTDAENYEEGSNQPTVVVECVDPIALSVKIRDKCHCGHGHGNCCCGSIEELPQHVAAQMEDEVLDYAQHHQKNLVVTLGFFSVIRVERPGQFIIHAAEYSVPEKKCRVIDEQDACSVFDKMAFPFAEFAPPALGGLGGCAPIPSQNSSCGGCK